MTSCIVPGKVQNVVTEMRYGPGGQLVELIANNPVTGDQVTRYEYGVTLADSAVASNRLLRAEVYPDAADSSDRIKYGYNRQGQRTRMQDQNGSVHEYEHDLLGRQTADKVTALGDGVDGGVLRIGTTYEVRGMVEKVTSYSDAAGTTPVNEVQNVYNSFGQLKEQYQEHSGAVNTGTTPKVEYAYADGSANTTRSTSMTYPDGRELDYLYDDTHADKLSRIRTLRWDGADVCRYAYLGLNTFVTTDYLQPQIKLDYALGSGANPYAGFDRFGRIIDLLWAKYGASNSSSSSSGGAGNDLVHLKYGYDRASNRTFREDLVAQSYGKDFDELYEYDGLHRLKKFHRGRLTDDNRTITSPTLQQGWQFDATGNWRNFTQNDQSDPDQTLDQQRLANRVNEITQIARTVGPDWATPEYDRNGNMTVIPQPKEPTLAYRGIWDAWNRLTKLEEPDDGGWQTLQENVYGGQTRRVIRKDYEDGTPIETRHFYYTSQWQDIEERLAGEIDPNLQYLWGLRYIDDLVLRDRDTDDNGTLDERLCVIQDANWSVSAICGPTGLLSQRIFYSPYGVVRFCTASASNSTNVFDIEVLFTGIMRDSGTDFYIYRNRFYNPPLGCFASRDPIAYQGDGLGLYAYCAARPTFFVDPLGKECRHPDLRAALRLNKAKGFTPPVPTFPGAPVLPAGWFWDCEDTLQGLQGEFIENRTDGKCSWEVDARIYAIRCFRKMPHATIPGQFAIAGDGNKDSANNFVAQAVLLTQKCNYKCPCTDPPEDSITLTWCKDAIPAVFIADTLRQYAEVFIKEVEPTLPFYASDNFEAAFCKAAYTLPRAPKHDITTWSRARGTPEDLPKYEDK